MARRVFAALAAVLVLALVGCSPISAGTVTRKKFTPSHVISTVICIPSGKVTICHPQFIPVPDEWTLSIREGDQSGWVDVDEATFDRYEVGDYFAAGGSE